ncbi:PREDICTED: bone morphogenetic protein 2-like [Amphimedon queenslandica]|uniref:TGF-beta family profile domain-containing protein n=1 Tax=Amphimedon queenslandica TaxID=400682 RepID=A0A1X7VCN7_AMPQE|nr:PREDICTED: bone morphogenetic protein 2-like [Amphimedon queenslandica]|eukprot:XP_011402506.1 PREDICTED: bone morphogenetic protein 2-like [Amphimedon queenslandica]
MQERSYFLLIGVVALLLTTGPTLSSPLDNSKKEQSVFVDKDEGNPTTDSIITENHTDAPEVTRSSPTPVPPYVESLYECWQKEDSTQKRECLRSMDEVLDFEEIINSNTVNFLIGKGILDDDRNLSNVTSRPQYHSIKFNLSSIQYRDSNDSTLQYAELRIYKDRVVSDHLHSLNSSICPIENSGVTLSLLTSLMSDGKDHIIERVPISYESLLNEGWIKFHTNLKPVLSEWLQKSQEVERIFKLVLQGGCASIKLEEIGFSLQQDPLLVTFVRNKSNKMEEEVMEQMTKTTISMSRRKRETYSKPKDFGICKLHTYHVNFTSLGWNDFVLEPRSYKANFCAGSCVHPISKHMNGTLHSELIAFSHALDPQKVPNPCCVPTKLLSEMMLVRLDQQSIQLKIYPDMTVAECGCR